MIAGWVKTLLTPVFDIISEAVTDDDKKDALNAKIERVKISFEERVLDYEAKLLDLKGNIVLAEQKSRDWVVKRWRPAFMWTFLFMVINNYVIYPYVSLFTDKAIELTIEVWMQDLIKLGFSGYIVGRSAEKIFATIKNKPIE